MLEKQTQILAIAFVPLVAPIFKIVTVVSWVGFPLLFVFLVCFVSMLQTNSQKDNYLTLSSLLLTSLTQIDTVILDKVNWKAD